MRTCLILVLKSQSSSVNCNPTFELHLNKVKMNEWHWNKWPLELQISLFANLINIYIYITRGYLEFWKAVIQSINIIYIWTIAL